MTPLPALSRLIAATVLVASAAGAAAQGAPQAQQPWARPTVAGQSAGGGFVRLVGGPVADRLVGARSPASERMELHTMAMDGSVMRMRQVEAIEVPAGQTVELGPGGLHLMFIGLKAPLQVGSRVPVTLRFEKGGEVEVQMEVAVRAPGAAAGTMPAMPGGHKH